MLRKIHVKLVQSPGFTGSLYTSRVVLMWLNFWWTKTKNQQIFMEHHNNWHLRVLYLRSREVQKHQQFLWKRHTSMVLTQCHSAPEIIPSVVCLLLNKVHSGREHSFIPNAYISSKSHPTIGDYRSNRNFEDFLKWQTGRIIPTLPL